MAGRRARRAGPVKAAVVTGARCAPRSPRPPAEVVGPEETHDVCDRGSRVARQVEGVTRAAAGSAGDDERIAGIGRIAGAEAVPRDLCADVDGVVRAGRAVGEHQPREGLGARLRCALPVMVKFGGGNCRRVVRVDAGPAVLHDRVAAISGPAGPPPRRSLPPFDPESATRAWRRSGCRRRCSGPRRRWP